MMNKKETPRIGFFKYILIVPVICALLLMNCSQRTENGQGQTTVITPLSMKSESPDTVVYSTVEEMPQFPGGFEELRNFLIENLQYPEIAVKNGIQGKTFIKFIVEKTGKVKDVTVLRGVDPILDKEAVRVIRAMPDWIPGKEKGEAVNVYFTCPVTFTLPQK